MHFQSLSIILLFTLSHAADLSRPPLSYAALPNNTYTVPSNTSITTLLDFIHSREDLSQLSSALESVAGFIQAFSTTPTWKFTFFAPSDTAFNNTGTYYASFNATPKGKWALGNLITHHYVPNSVLSTEMFNNTDERRLMMASYLYVSVRNQGEVVLNDVARIVEGNFEVYNGIVHIVDYLLDPSAQIYEPDIPKLEQSFIPGSCSNPALAYC